MIAAPTYVLCKSDHFPIHFKVKIATKIRNQVKRKIWNFKKANWDRLNQDLLRIPWGHIIDSRDCESAWRNFKTVLFALVDKHIPKITVKSNFNAPWFDSECFEAYRKKERAHKQFKENSSLANELKRDVTRRDFKNMCSEKMRENLYNSDDPALITKKFWSHVKSNSKNSRLPECMNLDGVYRTQPGEKANLFNEFFFQQFSVASNYDIPIDWSNDNSFDIDFDCIKIGHLLSAINSNKAFGPDGIHGKILKNCAFSLASPLSMLFRLSYNSGDVPKDWRLANVVPIHKKGSKESIDNYRPISLTSLVMKTFERIIKEELLIRVNHLLDERQHGFLREKSCTTNMVGFVDNVVVSLNDSKTLSTDVVYFDFAKAFDSVNHDIILAKLKYSYNIDGRFLKFIRSYLKGREQAVVVDSHTSSSKPVLSGVPQGSILGPILFVLFINDLPNGLNHGTNITLYADDTKIWRPIKSFLDHTKLQADVNYLNTWATQNKMKFHPLKCKVISILSKPSPLNMLPCINFLYHIGSCILDYAESEKDLGVIINNKLNFEDHREHILSKAKQKFGILKRTCHFVRDAKRRRVLYLTLVRSLFEHCSPIWRPCRDTYMNRLEDFQKKCLKWVLSEEELSYSNRSTYLSKCKQASILPLKSRFEINDLVFLHKIVQGCIPIKLPSYLEWFDGSSRLRTTHLDKLSLVCTLVSKSKSSALLEKSYFYRSHTLWNHLPFEIRDTISPSLFRSKLESHFWDMCNHEWKELANT